MEVSMDVDLSKIEKEIRNDIEKYGKNIAKYSAAVARDELTKEAHVSIDIFYDDYTPIYYSRTGNMRNNTIKPYYTNGHGSVYRGGVEIFPGNDVYKDSADTVMATVFGGGYHGQSSIFWGNPLPMSPTPIDRILKYRTLIMGYGSVIEQGITKAQSEGYTYLQFQ